MKVVIKGISLFRVKSIPADYPKVRETSIWDDYSKDISVPGIPEPCCLLEFFVMSMPFLSSNHS